MQETIENLVTQYPEWSLDSNTLTGEWETANFDELRVIVGKLCELAAELNHHPTVTYAYKTLRVETTTHDAGNKLTEIDVELASRVSKLIE